MKKRILRPLPGMDLPFLILVLTLVGFGLVMLASAGRRLGLSAASAALRGAGALRDVAGQPGRLPYLP
mgnify:CR=1 FL=1